MVLPLQLTAVTFVLRNKFAAINALPHVGDIVTEFLIEDMALDRACELSRFGSVELLDYVWLKGLRDLKSSRWTVAKLVHSEPHYFQWEFPRALAEAIRRLDWGMIQWVLDHFPGCQFTESVTMAALESGELWLVLKLKAEESRGGYYWNSSANFRRAAQLGHWHLVRWLHNTFTTPAERYLKDCTVVSEAFDQNNVEEIKWLVSKGYPAHIPHVNDGAVEDWPIRAGIIHYLLEGGHIDAVRFVPEALNQAARLGDILYMQWLTTKYGTTTDAYVRALTSVSQQGNLSVVQYLIARIKERDGTFDLSVALRASAMCGRLEVVRWLHEQYGHDCNANLYADQTIPSPASFTLSPMTAMDGAAKGGHLEVLQFLHQVDQSMQTKRKERDWEIPSAEDGNRQLTRPHCTSMAMDAAAEFGHFDVVKWLHANRSEGCTNGAMRGAVTFGHLNVVQWLHANRPEGSASEAMYIAVLRKQFEVMRWLHENTDASCPPEAMNAAADEGRLDAAKWLHENCSVECTWETLERAAAGAHLDVVKWLIENRPKMSRMEGHTAFANPCFCCDNCCISLARTLHVVRRLMTYCTGCSALPAIAHAIHSGRFEAALFLHADGYGADEMHNNAVQDSGLRRGSQHTRAWFDEAYPPSST